MKTFFAKCQADKLSVCFDLGIKRRLEPVEMAI